LLVDYFLRHLSRQLNRNVHTITPEALDCLRECDWPGNVRQLQGVIKYALIKSAGEVLTLESLPEDIRSGRSALARTPSAETLDVVEMTKRLLSAGEPEIYRLICKEVDRVVLDTVLQHVKGNQVQASELLGISRTTLRAKIRELGIAIERPANLEEEQ
jgi:two-component system nitrogen regulation response regulator GlnG